jgi:hypothetical protein
MARAPGWALSEPDKDLPVGGAVMSSMVRRTMRVAGWANSSIRQAATRERRGCGRRVRTWPSSSSRRCWVIGATRRTGSGGSYQFPASRYLEMAARGEDKRVLVGKTPDRLSAILDSRNSTLT